MKVRSAGWFTLAMVLLAPLLYFTYDRIEFVLRSQTVVSDVVNLVGRNERCGTKRNKYDCTKFTATLRYRVDANEYHIDASAGDARGHDQPTGMSDYAVGSPVIVAYDPQQPGRAYRDTFWDIWGAPFGLFLFQIFSTVASFSEKRRGR